MKALMKKASASFKRLQKPQEDIQETMNKIQVKQICILIGIGENQVDRFGDFFEQVRKLKLPKGYTRRLNPQKTQVIYTNQLLQITQNVHPSIEFIKILFYKILANNKAVYTFEAKQRKLLPYVEDKMMRQSIAINSKRREAEKVNLQRDENGKMVLSKLKRIAPDTSNLIGTRGYLLKMLVEKIYTKRQLWGKGKRISAYTSILSAYHTKIKSASPELDDQEVQSQLSLQKYQQIFTKAQKYYQQQFGDLNHIPAKILKSQEYIRGTPENLLKNTYILNINKKNLQLFWLARMMDCLPLPPYWHLKLGISYNQYVYQPQNLTFDIHPSYIYIVKQMNRFRGQYQKMHPIQQNYYNNMRQMLFFDYFERPYKIDVYFLINSNQEQIHDEKHKKNKKVSKKAQLISSDWMIMEGVNNSNLTPSNYVLTQHIQQFWMQYDFSNQTYSPSISPYGEVVWSSNITGRCIDYCPYQQELCNLIATQTSNLPQIQQIDYKKQLYQFDDNVRELFLGRMPQQRQKFLDYYIRHLNIPNPWPYQIKNDHFYDDNFISPFDLLSGLSFPEGQPIWMEKIKAKRMISIYSLLLNDKINDYYDELLVKFKQYAIQSTKIHQPTRLDQVQFHLSKIANKKQLMRFLRNFNDIDMREQRKRLLLEMNKQVINDDIFGSSISNIDLEQLEGSSEEDKQQELEQQPQSQKDLIQELLKDNFSEDSKSQKEQINIIQPSQESNTTSQKEEQLQPVKEFKQKYHKQQKIQNITDKELNKKIKQMKKQQIKKHKYVRNQKNKVKFQAKQAANNRIVKQNILITKNKTPHLPYKNINNFENIEVNKQYGYQNRRYTPYQEPDQTQSFTPFQSEVSNYPNQQVIEQIKQWQSAILKQNTKDIQINNTNNISKRKEADQTNNTIILQPIRRIKPLIEEDPILIHYKNVKEVHSFRNTFASKFDSVTKVTNNDSKDLESVNINKNKTKSSSNLMNSKSIPNKTLQPINAISSFQSTKFLKNNSGNPQNQSTIFNRICLHKTAEHFLPTNPILRKGDLVTIEAQKRLLSKCRGLQTFIAKKY